MLASGLIGALTLVLADLAARTLASPNELPIGLVTALIGSPVLIYSVKKRTSKNA
jgi:iron complex transport system permease protein